MTPFQIVLCSTVALSLGCGQVLFKKAGLYWETASSLGKKFPYSIISGWLIGALFLYALTTLLWIYVLRTVPLTKAYVFSLAGSALVPIVGYYLFKEPINIQFVIGFGLILLGVMLCIR